MTANSQNKRGSHVVSKTVLPCSVDFKLVNENKNSGPYIEVVIFDSQQKSQTLLQSVSVLGELTSSTIRLKNEN